MKKILAFVLAACMLLALTACGSSAPAATEAPAAPATEAPAAEAPATEAPAEAPAEAKAYKVGVSQFVQHPALDAATQGFMDKLTELLAADGATVEFDVQNASGDMATCGTIANAFVTAEVDLIMANATPALQAASAATADIPILGTSVTEYGVAMGIQDFNGTVGGNVSGTSDLAPLDKQAEMLNAWFPDAKNVGLLYCSAEQNSQYQVDTVQKYLEELGYTCKQYSFADSSDMQSVVTTCAAESDVVYVPTDNAVASATGIVDPICQAEKVPVIAGEEGICAGCGVATLSISYYDLGVKTGEMAYEVLTGKADISTMPVGYAATQTPKYNPTICDALGLTPLDGYEAIG